MNRIASSCHIKKEKRNLGTGIAVLKNSRINFIFPDFADKTKQALAFLLKKGKKICFAERMYSISCIGVSWVALIRGCHVIGLHSADSPDWIAREIVAHSALRIGNANQGTAVWAYFVDMVIAGFKHHPMLIFEVDENLVEKINIPLPRKSDYAIMKMSGKLFSYVPVNVLGFMNLPGLPRYREAIGFI